MCGVKLDFGGGEAVGLDGCGVLAETEAGGDEAAFGAGVKDGLVSEMDVCANDGRAGDVEHLALGTGGSGRTGLLSRDGDRKCEQSGLG